MFPLCEVMDKEPPFGILVAATLVICCLLGWAGYWRPTLGGAMVVAVSLLVPPLFACWVGIFEARNRFLGDAIKTEDLAYWRFCIAAPWLLLACYAASFAVRRAYQRKTKTG